MDQNQSLNLRGIEHADPGKARKVTAVKGENIGNGMGLHHCDQMGIMGLLARDVLRDHKALPSLQHIRRVG
jgi:hypothetical protein